jgi:hypothetical protein
MSGREEYGVRVPLLPRPRSSDEALIAAAPAGARRLERTAYLAETEVGEIGTGSGFGGRPTCLTVSSTYDARAAAM